MDIVGRLAEIQQEIQTAETEKLQQENALGLLWEHPPALDPEVVGRVMQRIRDRIRSLEDRKRSLLLEQQELLLQAAAAANPPPNPPGNEH
jgi:hypothetical protein